VTKPLVDLPDAEVVVIDILLAAGYPVVRPQYPSATLTGTNTVLQVQLESSDTTGYPFVERAQVRVTAHAAPGRRDAVKELAGDALADLYSYAGDADVAGIVARGGRSAVVTDPSTRNEMCWVLVRADLKASSAS
jgi:hypothetical protein